MTQPANTGTDLRCDLLLLTVTQTEQEQLLEVAAELGISVTERVDKLSRKFHDFGELGAYRVLAIRSRMGALGYGGSASMAQIYRAETQAMGIIAVGMAFGISKQLQDIGDVLVSEGMFPYDDRNIVSVNGQPQYDYEGASVVAGVVSPPESHAGKLAKYRRARPALVSFFQRRVKARTDFGVHFGAQNYVKARTDFRVHSGALLSGGARIRCAAYRDMLYRRFERRGKLIVGGEMEAVGLLSCSDPNDPWWIVVKGISDFADEERDLGIEDNRRLACRNAARFVLASMPVR